MAANQLLIERESAPQARFNVPNELIVPNGLNVHEQPAPRAPPPTYCERGENQFKCIYIKSEVYKEDIIINKKQTNMVLIGQGFQKTTVSGSNLSSKATLEVVGDGFVAKDIAFESLLGPKRNTTAAYIVGDKCTFHCCSLQGNQSTLIVDEHGQFFRDCKVSRSTSVIYGGATTVFQNCIIGVGQPSGKKDNIITIQGRSNNFTAGFIFHSCRLLSSNNSDLALGHTFIASPQGIYSR